MARSPSPRAEERKERRERSSKDRDHRRDDKYRESRKERKDRDKERERERDRDSHRSSRKDSVNEEDKEVKVENQLPKEDENAAEEKPKNSTEDVQQRIATMREARLNSKKKDDDDILAWVNKSRTLGKQKPTKKAPPKIAPKAACMAEDENEGEEQRGEGGYSSKDLAGLKVRHGLDQVVEGGEVVLTLKDKRIIEGEDLNEEADELENVNIAEQKARSEAYKAAKKDTGLNEDRFQNDINSVNTILPKYDDAVKDEGLMLDESGVIEDTNKKLDEVRRKLQATMKIESLAGPATVAKDFYTEEEMMQFKKPKKKKKLRKKDVLDVDAIEAEAKAAGLNDLGSRDANRNSKQEEQEAADKARKAAYENALNKAQEASKVLRGDSKASETVVEDDEDLYRSLNKARGEALKKRAAATVLGPEGVAARLALLSKASEQKPIEVDGEKPVVITDTEEFCLSLQIDDVITRRSAGHTGAQNHDEETAEDMETEGTVAPVDADGGWVEVDGSDNAADAPTKDEHKSLEDELPIKEVSVGKGLAGVLQLLHERGSLKDPIEWGGRNMDKKASKLVGIVDTDGSGEREILLDRRDEYGRIMTPKEAFRKLSHKFHGKVPGKAKQEKKMKQYEDEQKRKRMSSDDKPAGSVEKMREVQAKMHAPYIVLSGHIKPGQTSDPRSGFATVEKEAVGSLTPMLGDKKVEHLKRRADAPLPPPVPKRR